MSLGDRLRHDVRFPVRLTGAPDSEDDSIARHLTLVPGRGEVYREHPGAGWQIFQDREAL